MNYDQNYIFNCGVFIYMAYMCLVTHFYAVVVIALTFTIVWLTKLNYKSLFFKKGLTESRTSRTCSSCRTNSVVLTMMRCSFG